MMVSRSNSANTPRSWTSIRPIAVGSDADLLILDPQVRQTIDGRSMRSRAGYSAYDGHEVYGWPRFTVRRGEVVLADGEVLAQPGTGQWLARGPAPTCL